MLSPEQKRQAVQAAKEIQWHRAQLKRWEPLYQKAIQAGDENEATGIAAVMDMHNLAIEAARQVLESLGL